MKNNIINLIMRGIQSGYANVLYRRDYAKKQPLMIYELNGNRGFDKAWG
jgi:hypothetical protein